MYRISKHLHKPRLDQLVQLGKLLFAERDQGVKFYKIASNAFLIFYSRDFDLIIFKKRFWHPLLPAAAGHVLFTGSAELLPACKKI